MKWGCFPHEVLARGTSRQIEEMRAFERLEPFGDEWRQTAQMTAAIWNSQLAAKDQIPLERFMPLPPKEPDEEDFEPQTVEEVLACFASAGVQVETDGNH